MPPCWAEPQGPGRNQLPASLNAARLPAERCVSDEPQIRISPLDTQVIAEHVVAALRQYGRAHGPTPTRRKRLMSETTRAYIYRVLTALSVVAVAYGVLTEQEVALWLTVAAAVLGNGLAAINTTTKG